MLEKIKSRINKLTISKRLKDEEERKKFLKEIGCGHIQGYYYGKPEPIEDVFRHLDENGIKNEKIEWSKVHQGKF